MALLASAGGLFLGACGSGGETAGTDTGSREAATSAAVGPNASTSRAVVPRASTSTVAGPKASTSTVAGPKASTPSSSGAREGDGVSNDFSLIREERQANETAVTLQRMLSAIRGGGGNAKLGAYALCMQLSGSARREMIEAKRGEAPSSDCETAIVSLLEGPGKEGPLAEAAEGRVVEVRIHGASAAITVQTTRHKISHLALAREGGQWKLAGLG